MEKTRVGLLTFLDLVGRLVRVPENFTLRTDAEVRLRNLGGVAVGLVAFCHGNLLILDGRGGSHGRTAYCRRLTVS